MIKCILVKKREFSWIQNAQNDNKFFCPTQLTLDLSNFLYTSLFKLEGYFSVSFFSADNFEDDVA